MLTIFKSKKFWVIASAFIVVLFIALVAINRNVPDVPEVNVQIPQQETSEEPPAAKIIVGDGVFVNNFMVDSEKLPGNNAKLESNPGFEIFYFEPLDSFLISIIDIPFEAQRQLAESALLNKLAISEEEACTLDVAITTPAYVNSELAGQVFGLSFCK